MPAKGWAKLTPEQVAAGIESYFNECDNTKRTVIVGKRVAEVSRPYTIIGLCNHLGINKDTFYDWLGGNHTHDKAADEAAEAGKPRGAYTRVSDMLARARGRVESSTLERSLTGELDSKVAGMVLGNMGYAQQSETTIKGGMTVTWQGVSPKEAESYSQ
jgi:hypothetical protein